MQQAGRLAWGLPRLVMIVAWQRKVPKIRMLSGQCQCGVMIDWKTESDEYLPIRQ